MLNIIFEWVIQPVGLIACTLVLTLVSWCFAGAKPRGSFFLFCCTSLLFYVFSIPAIANSVVWQLENGRTNPALCSIDNQAPLVVLGGGIDYYVPSNSAYEVLKHDSLVRTLRAPEYASDSTHYYLLGGGNNKRVLAEIMKKLLIEKHVDANNIFIETSSKSTYENAQELRFMLPPSQTSVITLLTSMLHVKRAAATFEKQGYTVCHIGVDTQYSVPKAPLSLLPYLSGLQKSTLVLHEWIALLVYRIKGYT